MAEVIEKIGCERVMALGVRMNGKPVIGKTQPQGKDKNWLFRNGYYYFTQASNIVKQKCLREISDRLGLNLKISIVEK